MVRRKLLSQLACLPFFALGAAKAQEPPKSSKPLKIMMKSAWGHDAGVFRVRAWSSIGRSWSRRADFPYWRSDLLDAQGHSQCCVACGLAPIERDARKSCGKTYSNLLLRGLLPRPWGDGNGFEGMGSKIWQPGDIRLAGGMGGSDHYRIRVCLDFLAAS
jgi:hypothetical protein